MVDQDKSWEPNYICGSCRSTPGGWQHGTRKSMPFWILKICGELTNDLEYRSVLELSKHKKTKNRVTEAYQSVPSFIAVVLHHDELLAQCSY